MKLAALAALVLLAALLWSVNRERPAGRPAADLPMPAASARPPEHSGLELGRFSRIPGAPAASPREPIVAASVTPPRAPASRSSAAEDKASLLDDILRARNDNDPRLETAFNGLPPETLRSFREKYRRLPPENRNQRGTIVYLLGKNLVGPEDWAFLREVAGERPCLSMADCGKAAEGEDGGEVALAYPALVALFQAERVLSERGSASSRREALSVIRAAKSSAVPAVAEEAARLESRF